MEDQKQRVYEALNKMGIKYEVVEHEPVHTMEDMDRLGLPEKGTLCKNLFLRDSKGKRHFLITADEKTKVDLKALGRQLGADIKLCFRRTSGKISWCKTGKRYTFCPDERYGTCGGILYR